MGRVDELIRQLETGNYYERFQAAIELGKLGDPKAVPALLQTLTRPYESTDARAAAAHAIGKLGDLNAVPELLNAYKTHKGFVGLPIVEAVSEILGRTAPEDEKSRDVFSNAVNWLIEVAQERNSRLVFRDFQTLCKVRLAAVEALAKIRDPKVIPALTNQLHDDSLCIENAVAAARALRHFNDPQAIQALIQAAGNKNIADNVREVAVESLSDIGNPNAVDTLIQILEDRAERFPIRRAAARTLGRIGDPKAIEPLIGTLERERASVGGYIGGTTADILGADITKALGAFRDPRVTDALVKALGYEYSIAHGAAESLKKLRDRRAVEPLIRLAEKGGIYDHTPLLALQILGVLNDPRAVPTLVKAMRHPHPLMSQYATESLRRFLITHPDAILRAAPKDRNLIGRVFQDAERDEFTKSVCG